MDRICLRICDCRTPFRWNYTDVENEQYLFMRKVPGIYII